MPKNSILSNSLNFKAKINCNTTKQNDLKWGKTYTGLKFDLVHFNGPQTKFICDSLYKHPVDIVIVISVILIGNHCTAEQDRIRLVSCAAKDTNFSILLS